MFRAMMILVAAAMVVLASNALTQSDGLKEEFAKLGKAYDAAILARDAKALEKLYAADGQFIDADGKLTDREAYVGGMVKRMWESAQTLDQQVRQVSDTVVIETGRFSGAGKEDGKPFREQVRYLCVWVKRNGAWVLAAEQNTALVEAKQ